MSREEWAKKLHKIYAPHDTSACSYTDKDWEAAKELAAKDAEIERLRKALKSITDDRLSNPRRPQVPMNSYAYRLIKLAEQALKE